MATSLSLTDSPPVRMCLWCPPRSGSTALTKCMSSAFPDMEVWFEPYAFCFQAHRDAKKYLSMSLPSEGTYQEHEETYREAARLLNKITRSSQTPESMSYDLVKSRLEETTSPRVFLKDMAYAVAHQQQYHLLPAGFRHTFLIRHPLRVLHSNRKAMVALYASIRHLEVDESQFDLEKDDHLMTSGFFVKDVYDLWQFVRENIEPRPIVIDGDELLSKPAEVLPKYCKALGIPYDASILKWDSSPGITKSWKTAFEGEGADLEVNFKSYFETAVMSGEFFPPSPMPTRDRLTDDVIRCSNQVMRYYNEMYENRLV